MLKTIQILGAQPAILDLLTAKDPAILVDTTKKVTLDVTTDGAYTHLYIFGKTNKELIGYQKGEAVSFDWPLDLVPDTYKVLVRNNNKGVFEKSFWVKVDVLPKTCTVSGYVFNDADADGVFDQPGESGASREVILTGVADSSPLTYKVTSDLEGLYKFVGLPAGQYQISRVFPAGYKLSNPTVAGGKTIDVTVAAGQDLTGINIGSTYDKPKPPPVIVEPTPDPVPDTTTPGKIKAIKSICSAMDIDPNYGITTRNGTVKWIDLLHRWNVQESRQWRSTSFKDGVNKSELDNYRRWAAYGITPIVCFTLGEGGANIPKASDVKDYFKRWTDAAAGLQYIAEIINEPNIKGYYGGTITQLVDQIVNPAYEVLHAAGVKVISPSVTGSIDYLRKLFAAGVHCDIAGFHPYRTSANDAYAAHRDVTKVVGDLPICYTEWCAGLGPNYRLFKDPSNTRKTSAQGTLFRTPAMSDDQILNVLQGSWDKIHSFGNLHSASYFIGNSRRWKHTTGPLNLLDDTVDSAGKLQALTTTRFAEDFFALAGT